MPLLAALAVVALIIILAIVIALLRAAGKSQLAIQVSNLSAEMESALARDQLDRAKKAAQDLLDLLNRENLRGGAFDRARARAEEIIRDP